MKNGGNGLDGVRAYLRVDGSPILCPFAFRSPARQPQKAPVSETMLAGHSCQEWGRSDGEKMGCGVGGLKVRDGASLTIPIDTGCVQLIALNDWHNWVKIDDR
jgi:hypothetical protein